MGYDIFVSYATQDKLFVDAMIHRLEEESYRCWYAPRDITAGVTWPAAISRAIREVPVMLLVFSASSNSSEEISRELSLASANKCLVIPVRIENITPSVELEYHLSNRHWLDVHGLAAEIAIGRVLEGLKRYSSLFPGRAGADAETSTVENIATDALGKNTGWPSGNATGNAPVDTTSEAMGGARNASTNSPAASSKSSFPLMGAAIVLLALLLGGGGLYWYTDRPVRDAADLLVEPAPQAGIYTYTSQVGHVKAFCLRLTPPTEPNTPEEYLVAMTGIGGPFEGKIVRCQVQFTNQDMRFYTLINGQKFIPLVVTPSGGATIYVPETAHEFASVSGLLYREPALVQAFLTAFKKDTRWTGIPN